MRYQCDHCEAPFEATEEQDGDKPRCPKCLRMTGVRPLAQGSSAARPRWLWPLVAVAALAVVGGGYALYASRRPPDAQTLQNGALEASTVADELARRGIEAGGYAQILAPNAAVEAFADKALAGASTPQAKAKAVVAAIEARRKAQAYVLWPLYEPRPEPPLTAGEVAQALQKDGAKKALYPFELAVFAAAVLREGDVPARVAEVYAFPSEKAPPDPSGRLGYYAVALGRQGSAAPQVFDVFAGRDSSPAAADVVLLGDLDVVAVALSLRAQAAIAKNEEPAQALRDVEAAIKLFPRSATLRTARGAVLIASAGENEGAAEFEAAAQMRPDPARRNNLAMLELAKGDRERAMREISQALEAAPDFALGHVTLATLHLAQAEPELARQELSKAESLDRALPTLPLAWAQYYASTGDMMQAVARAEQAVRVRPENVQARLLLGRLYRQAGRYDDMRREARAVLEHTPASQKDRTRQLLEAVLGPTALEMPDDGEQAAPSADALPDPGKLRLGEPTPGAPRTGGPSLLDEDEGGGLKLGGGPSNLKLRGPGSGLKLDLDE